VSAINPKYLPSELLRLAVSNETASFTAIDKTLHTLSPSTTMNIQLPAPAANVYIVLKDISGLLDTHVVNLIRNSTEKIDGISANILLESNYQSLTLFSNGTDWFII